MLQRFDEALLWAAEAHRTQTRKGGDIPYIGHLLGVASIVIDDGGNEDEAIAALLHDAVEDSDNGEAALREIRKRWGDRVGDIVLALSDTVGDGQEKPPWRPRKEAYLRTLETETDRGVLRVSLADKLYNARSILLDLRRCQDVWERFSAPKDDQLWALRELCRIFQKQYPGALSEELRATVQEIEKFSA